MISNKFCLIILLFSLQRSMLAQSKVHKFSLKDSVFEIGDAYRLRGIQFELSSCNLSKFSFSGLDSIVTFLQQNPRITIEIQRYGDDTDPRLSRRLGQCRATSIRDYFVLKGIDAKRLSAKSYGATRPLISEADIKKAKTKEEKAALRSYNMRTEFFITGIN